MGKLKNLSIALFGNRVTLASATIYITGLTIATNYDTSTLGYTLGGIAVSLGSGILGGTLCGAGTRIHYNRSLNHLDDNNGEFDERYLQKALESDFLVCNYCTEQGIYLAAKERGQISQFRKAQRKYSKNIIPTF